MAIAIRGTTPVTGGVTGTATVSATCTGTQQPQAGDVLLIIHGNNFYTLSAMPTPTVGGSTTGVTPVTNGTTDGGSSWAHVKSYTYVVGSTGDLTVSVTESAPGDEEKDLVIYVLSGVDNVNPVDTAGGQNGGSVATTSPTAPSVSPTSSDGFLICYTNSGGGTISTPYTPPSGMAEDCDFSVGGAMGVSSASLQLSSSGATGSKAFTAGNAPYGAISVVMQTAAGGPAPTGPDAVPTLPPWLLYQLAAAQRFSSPAAATIDGSASLTGAGTLTALATQGAADTATGAGTTTISATEGTVASPTGTGVLTNSAIQGSTGNPIGAGTLNAPAVEGVTASPTGAGTLSAPSTIQATVPLVGAGTLAALATLRPIVALTGAGTLTASAGQSANMNGAGTLAAAPTLLAPASLIGAGSAVDNPTQAPVLAVSGAGLLTALATQRATTAIGGVGSLTTTTSGLTSGTANLVGFGTLLADVDPCHIYRPGADKVFAPTGVITRPTGTTSRPSSGEISRPDSGLTDNPCP